MRNPKLKEIAIKNAISSWVDALNDKFEWYNGFAKGCTKEDIKKQIEYFENLKL